MAPSLAPSFAPSAAFITVFVPSSHIRRRGSSSFSLPHLGGVLRGNVAPHSSSPLGRLPGFSCRPAEPHRVSLVALPNF